MKEKKKKDHCFADFLKDLSVGLVLEMLFAAVWNILLFIPRQLISLYRNS
ncbi:hypothetical protein GPDM_08425 [Planococcus donghaensis MPA1U2]|uniref:Uncharacterized protein n=1 Tax=Planococcus donghaensis MPA1U2 TaxID=933115 RepID=E7RGT7_9BACL|nr:hypothetical protein GPDM_08425 [Planococcus donghaensis MPA1U2]